MKNLLNRSVRPLVLAAVFASLGAGARAQGVTANDAYVQAVNDYIDAASRETGTLRTELEKNEKAGKQAAWADVRESLKRCQSLIDQLKNAPAGQFDPTKAKYEAARAELQAKVAAARKG